MKPYLLFGLLCAFSLSACAQAPDPEVQGADAIPVQQALESPRVEAEPGTPKARALEAIASVNPQVQVDSVEPAPIDGYQEVVVGGQVVYVSNDGRYLIQGSLYDVEARRDLSQDGLAKVRRELMKLSPVEERIVFAPENPRYTVAVFTDVECGYCRRLHQEIDEYNRLGIAVQYLAFPRMGLESEDYRTMVSVWCAEDRNQALTDAKSGKRVASASCDNPVAAHWELGQRVGLQGTPLIVTESGMQMPGYMPPAALRDALDQMAAGEL
ncbi:MAG TPA: thioredoxin fold domain-containing protein [Candidatus Luteimonas excrementigallinarum]|nr:thioredoxin fold domain-containing protein [Candidatus Luteimonas excrementigallinarum]